MLVLALSVKQLARSIKLLKIVPDLTKHNMKNQELFDYMLNEHGVTLLESDMMEIERIVMEMPSKPIVQTKYERFVSDILKNFITSQCPRCEFGRVSHDHTEPLEWTTIEVYKCDRCNTEFV